MKKQILVLIPGFPKDRPQVIRMKGLLKPLQKSYNIHILTTSNENKEYFLDGFKVISIKSTLIGPIINPNYYPFNYAPWIHNNKVLSIIRKILSLLYFPDLYDLEFYRLSRKLKKTLKCNDYSCVIGSCAPFSIYRFGKIVNKYTKWIIDVGDPFIENSVIGQSVIRKKRKQWYEKKHIRYIDHFIVTNNETGSYYKELYPDSISETNLLVIPQGITKIDKHSKVIESDRDSISMVYLGNFYKNLREPDALFHAINNWNENKNNTQIRLEVFGKYSKYFLDKINKSNGVHYKGFVAFENVAETYQKYNYIIIIDNKYGLQTPGKLIEVLAQSKPIITLFNSKATPTYNFLKDMDVNLVENSTEKICTFFEESLHNARFDERIIYNIDDYFWDILATKLKNVI